MISRAIELEHANTMPTHHTLGMPRQLSNKVVKVDLELKEWMDSWKREDTIIFLYDSFGTVLVLS
jgi:hypothetical protein